MTTWSPRDIREFFVSSMPKVEVITAKPLSGGYWNEVFHLCTSRGEMVLKRYLTVMPGTLFPNQPEMEAAALQRLAGLGVAPAHLGFWPQERVLLYEYVAGDLWTADVASVAALLRRKETASATGFREVPLTMVDILNQGENLLSDCHSDELVGRLRACRPPVKVSPAASRLSLIHTDIGASNLIGTSEALRLIDWQCPAQGDLAEDVFSFLSPAFQILNRHPELTGGDRSSFFSALADPALEERLAILEPAFAWRMAAYCCRRLQSAEKAEVSQLYRVATASELSRLEVHA